MYKKIILSLLLIFILTGCTTPVKQSQSTAQTYIKSVWITYYELSQITIDHNEDEFKTEIENMFKGLSKNGFNRVTVQVRPFADSFYNSSIFPTSAYFVGTQGEEMKYDALQIMVDVAHKNKLSIEAWINPYRVSMNTDFSELSTNNPAIEFKDTEALIVCDSGIYFNPASSETTKIIVDGVKEIANNYEVDSICFDDYFYPTTSESIDKDYYNEYVKSGGELSLSDFRRDNVSNLIKSVYSAIKEINPNISFGISPASNIDNDYNSLYADVEMWATNEGYVDYLCPQIYFGFQNEKQPFMSTTKQWIEMADCDLYVALPLYKSGKLDEFAGDRGQNEFVENNNIISRQIIYLSKLDEIKGYYIFSYGSLTDNDETANLYSAMQ